MSSVPRHLSNQLLALALSFEFSTALAGPLSVYSANPYHEIVAKNIFRLRPPQPKPVEVITAPLPTLILTGITTILGKKQALLKIRFPASPSNPPKEESCILTEGQRDGPVQVLQIEVKQACVKVNNSGTIMSLTFEKNGPKTGVPAPRPAWSRLVGTRPYR